MLGGNILESPTVEFVYETGQCHESLVIEMFIREVLNIELISHDRMHRTLTVGDSPDFVRVELLPPVQGSSNINRDVDIPSVLGVRGSCTCQLLHESVVSVTDLVMLTNKLLNIIVMYNHSAVALLMAAPAVPHTTNGSFPAEDLNSFKLDHVYPPHQAYSDHRKGNSEDTAKPCGQR